jgi:nucleotide-binding universal stress UspA family protein
MARANDAKLSVLHVVVPDALIYLTPASPTITLDIQEKWARKEMQQIGARLGDLPHDTIVARGTEVWSAVKLKLRHLDSDLIVLGTHGRTGLSKALIGSVAERVLRNSAIPVMTVGPAVSRRPAGDGKFHRVLLATNFAPASANAVAHARAVAEHDQAELVLVHVCKNTGQRGSGKRSAFSVAEVLHRLYETIPCADALPQRPDAVVEYGEAAARILEVAKRREADLIVMGIRIAGSVFAATHLAAGTAHNVITQAPCPVLTVRAGARRRVEGHELSVESEERDENIETSKTPSSLST